MVARIDELMVNQTYIAPIAPVVRVQALDGGGPGAYLIASFSKGAQAGGAGYRHAASIYSTSE